MILTAGMALQHSLAGLIRVSHMIYPPKRDRLDIRRPWLHDRAWGNERTWMGGQRTRRSRRARDVPGEFAAK